MTIETTVTTKARDRTSTMANAISTIPTIATIAPLTPTIASDATTTTTTTTTVERTFTETSSNQEKTPGTANRSTTFHNSFRSNRDRKKPLHRDSGMKDSNQFTRLSKLTPSETVLSTMNKSIHLANRPDRRMTPIRSPLHRK